MTLKRKCAQRSCDREVDRVVFIQCDIFVFDRFGRAAWVLRHVSAAVARHPLREAQCPSPGPRIRAGGDRARRQEAEQVEQPITPLDREAQA